MKGTWRKWPVIGAEPSRLTAAPMPSSRLTESCSIGSGWRCEPRARPPSISVPTSCSRTTGVPSGRCVSAYVEAFAIKTLGLEPRPELYHRLAGLREQNGAVRRGPGLAPAGALGRPR